MINKLLNAISFIAGVLLVLSVCCLDSEGQFGTIAWFTAAGCLAWLCIYFFVLGGGYDGSGKTF